MAGTLPIKIKAPFGLSTKVVHLLHLCRVVGMALLPSPVLLCPALFYTVLECLYCSVLQCNLLHRYCSILRCTELQNLRVASEPSTILVMTHTSLPPSSDSRWLSSQPFRRISRPPEIPGRIDLTLVKLGLLDLSIHQSLHVSSLE